MYHDGTNSYLDNLIGGVLRIRGNSAGAVELHPKGGQYGVRTIPDGAVELYHSGTKQCETSANGLAFPSGKGIDFSATGGPTNGSGSSELLDDYEEGTFTPAFTMTSGGHNITYGTQQGNYTKIGNVITIEIYLSVNGINANGSGQLIISGLPFTKTGRYGGLNISYLTATNNTEITHALVDVASTNVYLYNYSGSTVSGITVASALTTSTEIMLNGIYYAA